jgi:hypothetical protein
MIEGKGISVAEYKKEEGAIRGREKAVELVE